MTSEELLEKGKKEFNESILFYRDKLVKKLVALDVESINLDALEDDWNRLHESVHYKEAVELLQDKNFVKEL